MAKEKSDANTESSAEGASAGANQMLGAVIDALTKLSSGTVDSKTEDLLKKLANNVDSRSYVSDKASTDYMGEEVAGFQTLMIPANMKQTYDLFQGLLVADITQRQKHQARVDAIAESQLMETNALTRAKLSDANEVGKRISMMQNSQENKAFDHIWNLEPAEAKAVVAVLEALRGPEGAVLITAIEKLINAQPEG